MPDDRFSAIEIGTFVTAIIGAVTGIAGTLLALWSIWRQLDQDKVKLRVEAKHAFLAAEPRVRRFCIEITNLSAFPVTIQEASVLRRDEKSRAYCFAYFTSTREQLPIRLEPRTSVSIFMHPEFHLSEDFKASVCAYVKTACNEVFHSDRDAFKNFLSAN